MISTDRYELHRQVTALREIYVPYETLDDIQQALDILQRRDNGGSEGGIMMLTGPSRCGKTKVLKDFKEAHPAQPGAIRKSSGEFATHTPVVYMKVPDTNVKNLLERLLAILLGVPTSEVKGMGSRRFDIQDDIVDVAREVKTRLVILDEAHQGIDNKDLKAAGVTATVLKDLANAGEFSLAVAGTERTRALQEANEEFKLRCIYDFKLEAFAWDNLRGRKILCDMLWEIDEHLRENVFGRSSGLAESAIASALCQAGGGLIGAAALLVERGGVIAVDDMLAGKAKCLTLTHLGKAFRSSSLRHEVECDPFPTSEDEAAPTIADSGVMTGLKGRTRRAGHDIAYRR